MKRQILVISTALISTVFMGCSQFEELEADSNENILSREIKKVETLFNQSSLQDEKEEYTESEDEVKIETSMSYQDRLVYYDYIARNGIKQVQPPYRTSNNTRAGGYGLVLKPKGVRCFPYDELILAMDCEDHREGSYVSGNTGETFVNSNGNVHFFFCVVPSSMTGGGGLDESSSGRFLRFFDCEDSDNDNKLYYNGLRVNNLDQCTYGIKGDGRGNITFYFNYNGGIQNDGFGRFGTTSNPSRNGIIHTDDEDDDNTNSYQYSQLVQTGYPAAIFERLDHNTTMRVYF